MPEVLTFIREWVGKADGDDLVLLVQALDAHIDVSLEGADIRVEVPMIEGVGAKILLPLNKHRYHCSEPTKSSAYRWS